MDRVGSSSVSLNRAIKESVELARNIAPLTNAWSARRPQIASAERSGSVLQSVRYPSLDMIKVRLDACKRMDAEEEVPRFHTYYTLSACALKELTYQELPGSARNELSLAERHMSIEEAVISTGDQEEMYDIDEEAEESGYTHKRTAQYRINGRQELIDYTLFEGYLHDGEELTGVSYRSDFTYPRGITIFSDGDPGSSRMPISSFKSAKRQLRDDMEFIDMLDASETLVAGQSRDEHARRILAMVSFLRLETDAHYIAQTLFE